MDGLTSGNFAFVPHAHRFAILLHRVRRGRVVAVLGLEATWDVRDLVPLRVEVLAHVEILDHAHWILCHGACVLASLVVASSTRRILRHSLLCKSGVWSGCAKQRDARVRNPHSERLRTRRPPSHQYAQAQTQTQTLRVAPSRRAMNLRAPTNSDAISRRIHRISSPTEARGGGKRGGSRGGGEEGREGKRGGKRGR